MFAFLGGYGVLENLKDQATDKADLFNRGYPCVLDLAKLKCPCGKRILDSDESTICAACGSATCSPACHQLHIQAHGDCLFYKNFHVEEGKEMLYQGLRGIRLKNILKMQKEGVPNFTQCSTVSARFLFAALGPSKNTLYLQRGFRIYGSPCVLSPIITLPCFRRRPSMP